MRFNIVHLMWLVFYAACFFAAVRWHGVHPDFGHHVDAFNASVIFGLSVVFFVRLVVSFISMLLDSWRSYQRNCCTEYAKYYTNGCKVCIR